MQDDLDTQSPYTTIIAKWESRGGASVVRLFYHSGGEDLGYGLKSVAGYSYKATGGMGTLGMFESHEKAIEYMESRVNMFQPDANKTPMKRVSFYRAVRGCSMTTLDK